MSLRCCPDVCLCLRIVVREDLTHGGRAKVYLCTRTGSHKTILQLSPTTPPYPSQCKRQPVKPVPGAFSAQLHRCPPSGRAFAQVAGSAEGTRSVFCQHDQWEPGSEQFALRARLSCESSRHRRPVSTVRFLLSDRCRNDYTAQGCCILISRASQYGLSHLCATAACGNQCSMLCNLRRLMSNMFCNFLAQE